VSAPMATMTFEKLQKFHSRMLRKQGDKVLNVGVCEHLLQLAEPSLFHVSAL
jgi:hypothetical protein